MNVLVAIVVAAVSLVGPASASSFVSLCQMDLKLSNRDLNSYYPSLVGTKSLSLLRYAGNWTGNGITDTCALILDGCENCGCSNTETPLLIQALGWSVQCETLPTNVVSIQQRTVDTSQTQTDEEPVHTDDHELTGTDPNQDTAQALLSDALNSDQSSDPYATPTATSTTTSTTDSSSDSDLQNRINEYMEVYNPAGPRSLGGSDTPTAPKSEEPKAESPAQETTTKAPVEKSTEKSTTEKEFFEVNPDTKETKKESGETSTEKAEPTEATAPLSEFMDVFGQMSSWRSRYFVVLGFFIVFTIIFIVVIVVLYLKLKAARNGKPARSPGPGTDDVRTPLAGNEHSFQFSDNSLPR